MPRAPGTRLGTCEILAPLGAGGMGEVHRDTVARLDLVDGSGGRLVTREVGSVHAESGEQGHTP